jgi:hypothetical protein
MTNLQHLAGTIELEPLNLSRIPYICSLLAPFQSLYHMNKSLLFFILYLGLNFVGLSQNSKPFNGTLTYRIERVDLKDSVEAKMIVFARDSLLKIVNFNSEMGKQETIKHLTQQKKYVLIQLEEGNFAIQFKEEESDTSAKPYTFKKQFGHVKIAGMRGNRLHFKHELAKNELTVIYTKKIDSKYLGAYTDAPGLLLQYYVVNDHGLYKYTLESIDSKIPPLSLFMIPADYQKISLKAFIEKTAGTSTTIKSTN